MNENTARALIEFVFQVENLARECQNPNLSPYLIDSAESLKKAIEHDETILWQSDVIWRPHTPTTPQ